ncbi:MAG: TonB family protein [Melioribacteraceae bacterium]|nr:TonB family protein [Melioribacteraceae bacterium]
MKIIFLFCHLVFLVIANEVFSQTGISRSFYPNGIPKSEISYVNDILDGLSLFYYSNGNLKSEKNYSRGKLVGFVREYFITGLLMEEYFLREGIKDGSHRVYFENGALKELIIYEKGIQIQRSGFSFDPNYIAPVEAYQAGNRQQQMFEKRKEVLICDVEICPVPVGGVKSIQDNLIYPEHALMYGLEGTVMLVTTISERGEVLTTEIVKGLGLGCDEAAQEAVKKSQFIPGQNLGKVVESKVTLNIEFKIFDRSLIQDNGNTANQIPVKTNSVSKEIAKNLESNIAKIKCDFEECPVPVNGIKSINEYFIVPSIAKRLKIKGDIIIEIILDKYGIVKDTKIIKGVGYGIDDSLEIAILKTRFIPAKSKGEDIDSKFQINYLFSYEEPF